MGVAVSRSFSLPVIEVDAASVPTGRRRALVWTSRYGDRHSTDLGSGVALGKKARKEKGKGAEPSRCHGRPANDPDYISPPP
ncbi:hypothetical protein MRX96_006073 [Rhipicephalus microplus]